MAALQKPLSSAVYFLKLIAEKKISPKVLTAHQRRICIRHLLLDGSYTQVEIASILEVHEASVSRDKRRIQEQNGWILDNLDDRRIAVDLITTAERAVARLTKAGRHKDAWTVAKELVEKLQSLGYVKQRPIQFQGKLTLEEMLRLASGGTEGEERVPGEPGGHSAELLTNGAH